MSLRLPYPKNGPFQQLKKFALQKMFHRFRVIKVQRLKILRARMSRLFSAYFGYLFFQNDEFFFAFLKERFNYFDDLGLWRHRSWVRILRIVFWLENILRSYFYFTIFNRCNGLFLSNKKEDNFYWSITLNLKKTHKSWNWKVCCPHLHTIFTDFRPLS